MKRMVAIIFSIWLGGQLGLITMVSPILFTHDILSNEIATKIMSQLFDITNLMGCIAIVLVLTQCRRQAYFARANILRKWLIFLLILLSISFFGFSSAVSQYPAHSLVNLLGGSLGMWRGGLHVLNALITLVGLGIAVRILRLET